MRITFPTPPYSTLGPSWFQFASSKRFWIILFAGEIGKKLMVVNLHSFSQISQFLDWCWKSPGPWDGHRLIWCSVGVTLFWVQLFTVSPLLLIVSLSNPLPVSCIPAFLLSFITDDDMRTRDGLTYRLIRLKPKASRLRGPCGPTHVLSWGLE